MTQSIKTTNSPEFTEDTSDQNWLNADLSRLDDYEPYDWGDVNPLTLGKPIKYIPNVGYEVEGGKDNV